MLTSGMVAVLDTGAAGATGSETGMAAGVAGTESFLKKISNSKNTQVKGIDERHKPAPRRMFERTSC